ncbi:MAG: SCO family protein [Thioclava marina]|uniref:SCO family protein n=1 Tax=Thioclava marina TaxID=1915077 RepID=A0ABX3MQK5_9RHOB|nr:MULTISPECIES: SCO family protein [Thioclava]TNE94388.1 MAG: SCO family protein [Paracoccaceae bacterium]MBC7146319.1 SCO family protein [Thioclava marina]MBD3801722.1 SCO family protein [Thioclava sp.]OOY13821.1 SCO family protein [Thioclava marina]OOY29529.1 SCO family protein [Thioclava sp. L04-15]
MNTVAKFSAIGAAIAVVAGLGITWFASTRVANDDIFAQCRSSVVAGGTGQIGGPFTLTDENGKTVTDKDVITEPSIIYFGYTYCPDVCPLDSARNAEAVAILESRGYSVTPVFISVDTARDTPETLRAFTELMSPKMIGLTGTPEQIRKASQEYRTYFKVQDPDDPYTLIDHSTQSYLVFPKIGFVEYFNRDTTPDQMADKVACFVDAWKKAGETAASGN